MATKNTPAANATAENGVKIINGVMNETPELKDAPRLKSDLSNLPEVSASINQYEPTQNAFATNMINRIGVVGTHMLAWKNPYWRVFMKGSFTYGGSVIENIYIGLAAHYNYAYSNNQGTEANFVYSRETPDIKTQFLNINIEETFKTTYSRFELQKAILNVANGGLESFINGIMSQLEQTIELFLADKFKELLQQGYKQGYIKQIKLPNGVNPLTGTVEDLKTFAATCRSLTRKMTFPSKAYNGAGVLNSSTLEDQHILLTPDLEAKMDVQLYSYAFNVNFSALKPDNAEEKVMIIDSYCGTADPSNETGVKMDKNVMALILDVKAVGYWEALRSAWTVYNGAQLYYNVFMTVAAAIGFVPFENAVAIVLDPEVL